MALISIISILLRGLVASLLGKVRRSEAPPPETSSIVPFQLTIFMIHTIDDSSWIFLLGLFSTTFKPYLTYHLNLCGTLATPVVFDGNRDGHCRSFSAQFADSFYLRVFGLNAAECKEVHPSSTREGASFQQFKLDCSPRLPRQRTSLSLFFGALWVGTSLPLLIFAARGLNSLS